MLVLRNTGTRSTHFAGHTWCPPRQMKKPIMADNQIKTRKAYRRTDDYTPGTPKVKLTTESLPPLTPTSVLIRVHAVSLNYRDANIANGGNPWPVTPHGIPCNGAAGEVIAVGERVKTLVVGDRVAPITDTENITGRESGRSWLAADEDGVLTGYLVFDEEKVCKLPDYLGWVGASLVPCAGVTAWTALKDVGVGKSVLIQGMCTLLLRMATVTDIGKGTGGVSMHRTDWTWRRDGLLSYKVNAQKLDK